MALFVILVLAGAGAALVWKGRSWLLRTIGLVVCVLCVLGPLLYTLGTQWL